MSVKQDRTGTRTAEDLRRRLNVKALDESVEVVEENKTTVDALSKSVNALNVSLNNTRNNYVSTLNQTFTEEQKERARNNIGAGNSSFSGSYTALSDAPNSLEDINTAEYFKLNNIESYAQKNVIEKIKVNGVEQSIVDKTVDIELADKNNYDLSLYKVNDLTILRSSCIEKNERVCMNFVGTLSMEANTTTTLFNLPTELSPAETKDFVVFGQSSNEDGYVGYGYITADGLLQVRFNAAITSYIRFQTVYDLDIKESEEE